MERRDILALHDSIAAFDGAIKVRARTIRPAFARAWLVEKRKFMSMTVSDDTVETIRRRLLEWADWLKAEGIDVIAGWASPGEVQAIIDRVTTYINTLNSDIMYDKRPETDKLRNGWRTFFDEWQIWRVSGWSTMWPWSATKAKEWEGRAKQYHDLYTQSGGKASAPATSLPLPPSKPKSDWWKYLLGAAGVIGAFFGAKALFGAASQTSASQSPASRVASAIL